MSKKLVAFFSASGTTKKVAQMIAEEAKADLFEIEPKVPYTKLDLDWMNKKSRSSVEMSDKKYRPAIMKKEMDMSSYDEILLGFPIWWYVAPTIINTFLEVTGINKKYFVTDMISNIPRLSSGKIDYNIIEKFINEENMDL